LEKGKGVVWKWVQVVMGVIDWWGIEKCVPCFVYLYFGVRWSRLCNLDEEGYARKMIQKLVYYWEGTDCGGFVMNAQNLNGKFFYVGLFAIWWSERFMVF
jgi:hypothetical protein